MEHLSNKFEIILLTLDKRIVWNNRWFSNYNNGLKNSLYLIECQNVLH